MPKTAKEITKQIQSEKQDKLDELVKEIQARYGEGSIMMLGQVRHVNIDSIPTGSISLDIASGVGGIPCGSVIEL